MRWNRVKSPELVHVSTGYDAKRETHHLDVASLQGGELAVVVQTDLVGEPLEYPNQTPPSQWVFAVDLHGRRSNSLVASPSEDLKVITTTPCGPNQHTWETTVSVKALGRASKPEKDHVKFSCKNC